MDIEIFTLCDGAADYNGRLNILGVFDTIHAAQLPAVHPFCAVALRIRVDSTERGPHRLALHIVDQDGNAVMPPLEGEFHIGLPENQPLGSINLVLNLGGLPVKRYGIHEVKLVLDGQVKGEVPFWVKPMEDKEKKP